jgi:DNA-binding transcriptional regulator YhcF (GntR family)
MPIFDSFIKDVFYKGKDVFNKGKAFLCLWKIRKANNSEELAAAIEEAKQLSIREEDVQEAVKKGGESALEKIASSTDLEQYQEAVARAMLFKRDDEMMTAKEKCKKNVLELIRDCRQDSGLTKLKAFAEELSIDANALSEVLNDCKVKVLSEFSKIGDKVQLDNYLGMAFHCGASYEEVVLAKKKAQPDLLNRILMADSVESAKQLLPVALSFGIDYSLIESILKRLEAQNRATAKRQANIFFAGAKALQAERDMFSHEISILQTDWKEKGIEISSFSYQNFVHELTEKPKQEIYNDFIRNYTDAIIFVLSGNVGGITREEFDVAYDAFRRAGRPKIFVYSKTTDVPNEDILNIRKRIDEIKQYWQDYTDNNNLRLLIKNDLTVRIIQKMYEEMWEKTERS